MASWIVTKYEGAVETGRWELPEVLDEAQVEEIVRRLVCRDLSEDEILNSSLPADSAKKYVLLDRNDVVRSFTWARTHFIRPGFLV